MVRTYHIIDKGYTSYLGKYLNKYEGYGSNRQKVCRYTDFFVLVCLKKYGLGSIGFSSYKENNQSDYKRFWKIWINALNVIFYFALHFSINRLTALIETIVLRNILVLSSPDLPKYIE